MTTVGAVNLPWERHLIAWYTGAAAVAVSSALTLMQVREHLLYNPSHKCRKYIIRILLMVPLYGFESWLGLRYYQNRFYWEILRDCYEAFVIFSFYMFLIEYLNGEDRIIYNLKHKILPEKKPQEGYGLYDSKKDLEHMHDDHDDEPFEPHQHLTPFKYFLPYWKEPETFVYRTKFGTLQYVYIKVILSVLELILLATGNYHHGDFSVTSFYMYDVVIQNFSQIYAMYCLVLLYLTMSRHLAPIRPVPKFLAVKLVVFFSFWQSVLIAGIQKLGWIQATQTYTSDDIAAGLQDFLIIWEMFIAAIAHKYVFRPDDFEEDENPTSPGKTPGRMSVVRALGSALNVADFLKHKAGPQKYKDTAKVPAGKSGSLEKPMDPSFRDASSPLNPIGEAASENSEVPITPKLQVSTSNEQKNELKDGTDVPVGSQLNPVPEAPSENLPDPVTREIQASTSEEQKKDQDPLKTESDAQQPKPAEDHANLNH